MRPTRAWIKTFYESPSDAASVSRVLRATSQVRKQSPIVALDRAAAQVFELVQQALRVRAAGEAA